MTIRISTIVLLQQPQSINTGRYKKTTSRAIARTKEDGDLMFELVFFFDNEYPFNNVTPDAYNDSEVLHFTGVLTEIADDVLHVTVQHARSLTLTDIPAHCVEINLTATVQSKLSTVHPHSDQDSDAETPEFSTFKVTAEQWVFIPRSDNANASRGRSVPFDFIIHHPPNHRLAGKTGKLKLQQTANFFGLLELISKKPYVQLTDVSWTSTSTTPHSSPSSSPSPFQNSRWSSNKNHVPTISATRALAASLASTNQTTSPEPTRPPKKPRHTKSTRSASLHEQPSSSSQTESRDAAQHVIDLENDPLIQQETAKEQDPPRWKFRSRKAPNFEQAQDLQGTDSFLSSEHECSEIAMIGGLPQLRSCSEIQSSSHVHKLRDHSTVVLPKRPFSFH